MILHFFLKDKTLLFKRKFKTSKGSKFLMIGLAVGEEKILTPKYVQYNWRASRTKWLATSFAVEVRVEGLTVLKWET